jgi:hypothetical protein
MQVEYGGVLIKGGLKESAREWEARTRLVTLTELNFDPPKMVGTVAATDTFGVEFKSFSLPVGPSLPGQKEHL